MSYISVEKVLFDKLVCNHPKVDFIWQWGGLSGIAPTSVAKRYVSIMLKDGTRKDFEDEGKDNLAVKEAEAFLETL